jgi:hypothetical protein
VWTKFNLSCFRQATRCLGYLRDTTARHVTQVHRLPNQQKSVLLSLPDTPCTCGSDFRFHQMTGRGRAPIRAERSACGTLPVRAVRYCEALTSATAFGWWLFSPIDIEMLWDGSEIFWRCDDAPDWMPLLPSAQLPNYAAEFDAFVPEALKGCSPPFLTALPEPGTVQL